MRLLRSILAAVALCGLAASCADSDAPLDAASALDNLPPGTPVYLAFNLVDAASLSRADDPADDPEFVNGTEAESKINSVNFYFFDEDGKQHPVSGPTQSYLLIKNFSASVNQPNGGNVETVCSAVIMLRASENGGNPLPHYVGVIVNPPPSGVLTNYKLSEFRNKTLSSKKDKSSIIMTNSVYMRDGEVADVVRIDDRLAISEEAAKQNPVNIYVERAEARFDIIANKIGDVYKYCVSGDPDAPDAIFAHLIGWDVVQYNKNFKLIKEIDPSWSDADLGFKWNDPLNFRSYWAMPYSSSNGKQYNTFSSISATELTPDQHQTVTISDFTYYRTESNDPDCPPCVILTAQLQDRNKIPHPYFRYMGRDLDSEEAVIDAIALTFKGKYWTKIGGDNFTPIAPADIDLQPGFKLNADADSKAWGRKDYETVAQLRDGVTIYKGGADGSMPSPDALPEEAADVNKDLASFPALIASNGYVYYFLPITHLGGHLGYVRNHLYRINVNSIFGLGTPVFEPWTEDTQKNRWPDGKSAHYPIIPLLVTGTESHVDADIKVHSWRIVDHHYVLDNANP